MIPRDHVALLTDNLSRLDEAARWLKRSQGICHSIDVAGELREQDFDALEAFASCFARVSDMIVHRVLQYTPVILATVEKTREYSEKLQDR